MDYNWMCPKCMNTEYIKGKPEMMITTEGCEERKFDVTDGLKDGLKYAIGGGSSHGKVGGIAGFLFGMYLGGYKKHPGCRIKKRTECHCSRCGYEFEEIVDVKE